MAQTAQKRSDPIAPEEETIPPIRRKEREEPIAAAGVMADLNPVPPTPRPDSEEEEIAIASGRYAAPAPRASWTGLWVVLGVIAVLVVLALFVFR